MSADLMRQLLALELSTEQALAVLDIIEARESDRKEKGRERWHRWNDKRLSNVSKREPTLANVSSPTHARAVPSEEDIKERKKDNTPPSARVEFEAELSTILDPERIAAIVGLRRKKGAVLTAHAGRLLVKALSACPDIAAAADEMVLRNWTGIKPEWLDGRQHGPPTGRRMNAVEAYQEIARMKGWDSEPGSIWGSHENAERLRPDGEPQGIVVDLRRGPGGDFGPSNLRDGEALPPQRNRTG